MNSYAPHTSIVVTFLEIHCRPRSRFEDQWNRYTIHCSHTPLLYIRVISGFISFNKIWILKCEKQQNTHNLTNMKYFVVFKIHLILKLKKKKKNGWDYNYKFYFKWKISRNILFRWITRKYRLFCVTAYFLFLCIEEHFTAAEKAPMCKKSLCIF